MEINEKKNYSGKDVNEYVALLKANYEKTIAELREILYQSQRDLEAAHAEINEMQKQKALISRAITAAITKADDIERVSMLKYNQEIARLKSFHDKWQNYYAKIIEKYPLSDDLMQTSSLNEKISEVLSQTDDIDARVEEEKRRLSESVAADDDDDGDGNGFSFAEALNPKDDLEKIMQDLGVLIDDE